MVKALNMAARLSRSRELEWLGFMRNVVESVSVQAV